MKLKLIIISHVMNTYCFITSTFILPRHLKGASGVGGKLYPGVGVMQPGEDIEYKAYYQAFYRLNIQFLVYVKLK